MEYYHLHTKGIKDAFWKEKREFIITDKFKNRLYDRTNNFTSILPINDLNIIYAMLEPELRDNFYRMFGNQVNLEFLIHYCLENVVDKKVLKMLLELSKLQTYNSGMFKRELALENYRKDNFPNIPSRLHSLFVTTEDGIRFWQSRLIDSDLEVFKLDIMDEPFVTNESYLPYESLVYGDYYQAASGYWYPNLKKDNPLTREYLVQGKVKILEKVAEIQKK